MRLGQRIFFLSEVSSPVHDIHILSINKLYWYKNMCRYIKNRGDLSLEKQRKKSSMRETKDVIVTRGGQELLKKMQSLTPANNAYFKEERK